MLMPTRSITSCLLVLLMLASTAMFTGCAPQYKDFDTFMTTPRAIVGGKPYVIEPPDRLRIISPGAPELHDQEVVLRPDGYVTLYLAGDVFAAGKTPTQLAAELQESLLKYYEDLTVQIEVIGFNSKFYYMAGETRSGPRQYTGKDTVLDAVLSSGVPITAWPENLVVLRPNEDGKLIRRMTINFRDMTEKGDLKYNAVLEEGDIIFMPINPLGAVGRVFQTLLLPVDPAIRAVATPARAAAAPGLN